MGLDMYLYKVKRIDNASARDLAVINNYFEWMKHELDNDIHYEMEDWCGIGLEDVNIPLAHKYLREYKKRYATWDTEMKYGWRTIYEMIGYWRKANHIHKWFVDNVQGGNDDCSDYEVSKGKLEALLCLCKVVKDNSKLVDGKVQNGYKFENYKEVPIMEDGQYIEDSTIAEKLLPRKNGCFFGGTGYDQWYMAAIEKTIEILETVLKETDFENEMIIYSASW